MTGQLLEDLVTPVLLSIDEWMSRHGLELAHHKTEAVILSRRRAFVPPRLSIGGHPITLYGRIRYRGGDPGQEIDLPASRRHRGEEGLKNGSRAG